MLENVCVGQHPHSLTSRNIAFSAERNAEMLILNIQTVGAGLSFVGQRTVVRGESLLRKPYLMSVDLVMATGDAR